MLINVAFGITGIGIKKFITIKVNANKVNVLFKKLFLKLISGKNTINAPRPNCQTLVGKRKKAGSELPQFKK